MVPTEITVFKKKIGHIHIIIPSIIPTYKKIVYCFQAYTVHISEESSGKARDWQRSGTELDKKMRLPFRRFLINYN